MSGVVLRESLKLWGEFFSDGSLYTVPPDTDPAVVPAELDNLLARAGVLPDRARSLVETAAGVDLADNEEQTRLATRLLELFDEALHAASDANRDGEARVVDERSGEWIDASPWLHGWSRRSHMLEQTTACIPYIDEIGDLAVAAVKQTATVRSEMHEALSDLKGLNTQLAEARAERAQNELATHFSGLAKTERLASNAFRGLTACLLLAAAVVGWRLAGVDEWQGAVAHALVVAAIGGAAAYTARLGTLHRATADWAKSIHVQLDTFKDFLAEVKDDDVKNRVYEEFGRRVLGAPPAAHGDESSPLPTAQVIELASIIANASRK